MVLFDSAMADEGASSIERGPGVRSRVTAEQLVGAACFVLIGLVVITGQPGETGEEIQLQVWRAFRFLFLSPLSLVILGVIFALEHRFPAREEQRGFSPAVAMDALYLLITRPIAIVLIAVAFTPLRDFTDTTLGALALDTNADLPMPVLLVAGVAVGDFVLWFSHVVRHKVPFLWRFHMIHHSQSRLSVFSASRDHPLDTLFETFIMFLPLAVLFPSVLEDARALTLYAVGVTWFIRFSHANIRTNLGPLRWILVTPQSHRIHHSARPEHWNSNYANIFAWDRLFGFQNDDVTSYPDTGVNHPDFPEPETYSPLEFARCFAGQLSFPFDTEAVNTATEAREAPNDIS